MAETVKPECAFSSSPPWALRCSERLDTGEGATLRQRILARLARQFRYRAALPEEFYVQLLTDPHGCELTVVAPRVPLAMTVKVEPARELTHAAIQVLHNGRWRDEIVICTPEPMNQKGALFIQFRRLALLVKIRIIIDDLRPEEALNIGLFVGNYRYADWGFLNEARNLAGEGHERLAEDEYLDALRLAPTNGTAACELGRLLLKRGETRQAERWLLAAGTYGCSETATRLLQEMYKVTGTGLGEDARTLQQQAAGWPDGDHHGAIYLQINQQFWLGFDRWHLVKQRSLVEIRRRAAARMFRQLSFTVSPHNEFLLFTRMRIIHHDNTIRTVADEQLVFTDSPEHNPAIRTIESKDAVFLLPELHVGDIIELEYCLVHHNGLLSDGRPDFYLRTNLTSGFPTFAGEVTVIAPADWPITCIGINGAPTPEIQPKQKDWQTYVCEVNRLLPEERRAPTLERIIRNPQICASWANRTWEDVGVRELHSVGADVALADPLPRELVEIIAGGDSALEKLQSGFTWISSHLKYISLPSAKQRIATPGRAKHIIEQGAGDCHDKAYLLHLVCQKLGVQSEYLLVGKAEGHVIHELPGSQFDHILLRAELDGKWYYFDATDGITPGGQVPVILQGLDVLRLRPPYTLITLPEHDPSTNVLSIHEELECSREGLLIGRFRIEATGFAGRLLNDRWKSASMEAPVEDQAAQFVLKDHLPTAKAKQWEVRHSETELNRFVFTGEHLRGRLAAVGRQRTGVIRWNAALVPMDALQDRRWGDPAVLPPPLTMRFSVSFMGDGMRQIAVPAPIPQFAGEFGSISEKRDFAQSSLVIEREIIFKKRFVRGESTRQIPEFIGKIEDALHVAFILSNESAAPGN